MKLPKTLEYEEMKIKIRFISDILGTAPHPSIIKHIYPKKYAITEKRIAVNDDIKSLADQTFTEENYVIPDDFKNDEFRLTYFRRDEKENFIYIPNFMIKGFLKEGFYALKDQLVIKNPRGRVDRFIFIFPNKIKLYRNNELITTPDDIFIRPVRGKTPKGERVAVRGSERIRADEYNPVETNEIQIILIKNDQITVKDIECVLDYGLVNGISQFRTAGFGRFEWDYV